ncbi:hypothetical protein EZ313_20215 [Ramlibacter henchirensis]|uniref:Uncharacterized protein n=1 Tax=Ramlibacter henchirensis TaxID=204072 RepID=A0A4Z0BN98_9BURK|nr:hypothetical protein [Ramlibacter henchirensis]TFZ00773.1 hypothetical protein EZ313_20215 [Ramlibacter henchirensis]
MQFRRCVTWLGLAAALLPLHAAAADPLKSDACGASLSALDSARRQGSAAQVEALRQQATRDCLGGSGDARRPSPVAREPIVVPPPVITAEPAQPSNPAPPAPPVFQPPPVVTSCDLGGCWDSNGTRLNRAGPLLIGPRGACVTSGATVHCP